MRASLTVSRASSPESDAGPLNLLFMVYPSSLLGFPGGRVVKIPPANAGDEGQEDRLEENKATLSTILA